MSAVVDCPQFVWLPGSCHDQFVVMVNAQVLAVKGGLAAGITKLSDGEQGAGCELGEEMDLACSGW